MNKLLLFNLDQKYFRFTSPNLIIVLLVILSGVACTEQLKQKENKQAKPTTIREIVEISEQRDSTIFNQYKDGEKDGLWKTYYQNGQLKSEGTYTAGLKEGLHKEWEDDGILSLEGFYRKGKANGIMKWFHEKGHLAGAGNMIDDVRVGKWKICDIQENGFCIEAFFKNGKRDGLWKIYHEHATDKIWKEQTWKDDKVVAEKCWDENGKKIECK